MKPKYFGLVLLALGVLAVFFLISFWWSENTNPVSNSTERIRFVVSKGSSAEKIADELYKKNLIKNPLAFKIYVQVFDKAGKIQPGVFNIPANLSLEEVVGIILGKPDEIRITIPEGKRREEVLEILISGLDLREDEAEKFGEEFLSATREKEGYLFPDTYDFLPDSSASQVVTKLTSNFDIKFSQLEKEFINGLTGNNLSKFEVVTLASIIEREALTNEERPVISGILIKRLQTPGWLIQADAAVQFGVANTKCNETYPLCDNWWPILTLEDLQTDTPYNLYIRKPLPPTPIANPGFESLRAAVNPIDSQYWFYIHSGGNIYYAATLSEHNANVQRYLR